MSRQSRDDEFDDRTEARAERLFSALSNRTRVSILFALADAERERDGPVPFSELYRRVEVRDSSKFNYHLKALSEQFVRRTDDGYRLRYVGRLVYRAIKAGEYVDETVLEPTSVDSDCYKCGAGLSARFDDGRLVLRCDACEDLSYRITIPPGAFVDRTQEEFLAAADQQIRSDIGLLARGICPYCSGKTTPSVGDREDAPTDNVYIDHDCERCEQHILSTTAGELFLSHPAVVAFCFEHDVDLSDRPCWELGFCVTDDNVSLVTGDAWGLRFELSLDDEVLRVVLDDALQTVETGVEPTAAG